MATSKSSQAPGWWLGLLLPVLAGLAVLGAAQVDHRLGLAVLFAGFFVTLGFALNVDREPRLAPGRSAAWVLVCTEILLLGSWLGATFESEMTFPFQADSATLSPQKGSGHFAFQGHLYFSSSEVSGRLLMRSNGSSPVLVPPGVKDAHGFRERDGRLTFFGMASGASAGEGEALWGLRSDGSGAEVLQLFAGSRLFPTDADDASFKAVKSCGAFRSETLLSNFSLGTLDEEALAASESDCRLLAQGLEPRPGSSRLLAVLLCGVIPYTGLGAYLLVRKRVPGAFVILFAGAYILVLLIYLLMHGRLVPLLFFLQASSLTYTISACLVVAANQVAWQRATNASKDTFVLSLGCWAAGAVALGLAAALSLALPELPAAALGAGVLLVLAPLLRDALPVRLATMGFLALSSQAAEAFAASFAPGQGLPDMQLIGPLGFYLLGVLVLLGEEAYMSKRHFLEAQMCRRLFGPSETKPAAALESEPEAEAAAAEGLEPLLEPEEDQQQTWLLLQSMPLQQLLPLVQHLTGGQGTTASSAAYQADEEEC